jgi:hypothetical protein
MKNILPAFLLLLAINSGAQNLSKDAIKVLKKNLGADLKDYKFYSYPTNNFGVGTSCVKDWIPDGDMVADMVKTYGLSGVTWDSEAWKTVNGYAYKGSDGATIEVTEDLQKVFGFQIIIPKLLELFKLDVGINSDNSKSVTLKIDSGYKRFLNYESFLSYLTAHQETAMYKAFRANKLMVATGDFVITSFTLDITRKDSLGIKLVAKMEELLGSGANTLLNQDSLAISFMRKLDGTYSIVSRKPVVVAVYIKKQKPLAGNSALKGFDAWDVIKQEN